MQKNEVTYLTDYRIVNYKIKSISLHFDIYDDYTVVDNSMEIELADTETSISLLGAADLKCHYIHINGQEVQTQNISRKEEVLEIKVTQSNFNLTIRTEIYPKKNLSLNGLYFSGGSYFTQNEPHGFRHITFYADRPDVLSKFQTKITTSKDYQYLLSNGNLKESGNDEKDSSRHYCIWQDPFPKPCYLFALVVGNFDVLKDHFITKSNREVALEIYVDKGMLSQSHHAMESLKRSMIWDEQKYNCEYDLDIYMIVAAESFNMGAMENKGLNIFNSKYILGNLATATDDDLEAIEAVVAHEYFHNWTGNRVTCRDWFQLTLKEGLTVFRDQQFTADQHGEVVKRIKDVQLLRQRQFEEDAGPLSHPIRPSSYVEMNNFYTTTVYEKGAEVIRMLHSIVGDVAFVKSVQTYLKNFDGGAATVEDFISSFEIVTKRNFSLFMNWYKTKGTPVVTVKIEHVEPQSVILKLEQEWSQTENSTEINTLVELPIRLAWTSLAGSLASQGTLVKSKKSEIISTSTEEYLLILKDKEVEIKFKFPEQVEAPVLSFNRNFTSPIKVNKFFNLKQSKILAKHDKDFFNKWDECQNVFNTYFVNQIKQDDNIANEEFVSIISELWSEQLHLKDSNKYFSALYLSLPSENEINESLSFYQFEQVRHLRLSLLEQVSTKLKNLLQDSFSTLVDDESKWSAKDMGIRKLKNTLLDLLLSIKDPMAIEYALHALKKSTSMNQQFYSLYALNKYDLEQASEANQIFINRNKAMSLSVDKWLLAQMGNLKSTTLNKKLSELLESPYFDIRIPNRVYSLVIKWINNLAAFNNLKYPGYQTMTDLVLKIDQFNPQVASRVLKSIKPLEKLPIELKKSMKKELEAIYSTDKISKDSSEIVAKFLKG